MKTLDRGKSAWTFSGSTTYETPFIWREDNQVRCELAHFGLVPAWANDKPRFGTKAYNARSETVADKGLETKAVRLSHYAKLLRTLLRNRESHSMADKASRCDADSSRLYLGAIYRPCNRGNPFFI